MLCTFERHIHLREGVHTKGICCNVADLSLNFTTKRTTNPNVIFSFWFCGVMRTYTFHMITALAAITHQKLRFKQSECMLKWLNHLITISRGTLKIFHLCGSSWASSQDLLSMQKKLTVRNAEYVFEVVSQWLVFSLAQSHNPWNHVHKKQIKVSTLFWLH